MLLSSPFPLNIYNIKEWLFQEEFLMVNSAVPYPETLSRMAKEWEPVYSTTLLMRCSQEGLLQLASALCSINCSCIYVLCMSGQWKLNEQCWEETYWS